MAESNLPSAICHRPFPELLAPAGDWECAKAAVENGADAIYFGLDRFNARMRAHNFTEADLPALMEFLHRRGVKGYVTFNTLIFADELADAENYLRAIIAAGVDAAIVQDVGIARLIRRLSPDFPIHASTQMTITSPAGVEFARELGCNLVVLARENSLKEIAAIQKSFEFEVSSFESANAEANAKLETRNPKLPLEVFVHGALCVAYSGQCLTSESLGGRSANRGECAQACRMPYELISDGQVVPLGDKRYLLSPQDLSGLEVLPDLVKAGVASLKIEGRLKSPEYVASSTRVYREALDKLSEGRAPRVPDSKEVGTRGARPSDRYEMEMSFSRGLYPGWFGGINNQQLVHARFGKKRGVYLGAVSRVQGGRVFLKLAAALKPGDGVVFDAGRPDEKEEGGRVYHVEPRGGETSLSFGHGALDFSRVHVGDKLWKTNDPELDRRVRATFAGDAPKFQRPVTMEVHGHTGSPLTLIARDESGHVAQAASTAPLAKAEKQPLTTARLAEQLGRLGGTPFRLGEFKNRLEGEVIVPVSELNALRRAVVSRLEALRAQPRRWTMNPAVAALVRARAESGPATDSTRALTSAATQLVVLVRNLAQLEAALRCDVGTLYCDFEDPKKYREAVTLFHTARGCAHPASSIEHRASIWLAPPRIFKPGEEWILNLVRAANPDGYLVRNYDHLKFFADSRCVGDFSLNVANPLAADYFKNKFALERVTASYDLNNVQLDALLRAAPPEWFEVTIHQHMPMFHMEHCVFCAFLSSGKDYRDCGRPCDTHDVKLRDRVGLEHPLKADSGCRNTVFNARAQTGAESVAHLLALGVQNFRIEFVNETPAEVETTIARYRALLRGEITGTQLWQELKLHNQLGVTRGQMERAEVRQVFPKA
ncbi:MAG: U32 family peptidase [Verrucomicrobia bacterium]|nr:U32 family peptidase [Verrucomicrobiota bacterium]